AVVLGLGVERIGSRQAGGGGDVRPAIGTVAVRSQQDIVTLKTGNPVALAVERKRSDRPVRIADATGGKRDVGAGRNRTGRGAERLHDRRHVGHAAARQGGDKQVGDGRAAAGDEIITGASTESAVAAGGYVVKT